MEKRIRSSVFSLFFFFFRKRFFLGKRKRERERGGMDVFSKKKTRSGEVFPPTKSLETSSNERVAFFFVFGLWMIQKKQKTIISIIFIFEPFEFFE